MSPNGKAALRHAIKVLGSQKAVAEVVGRGQSAISECLRNGKAVPAEWCIPLEQATEAAGEKVSRNQLRPDLYPVEDSCACADEAHSDDHPHDPMPNVETEAA